MSEKPPLLSAIDEIRTANELPRAEKVHNELSTAAVTALAIYSAENSAS